MFANCNVCGSSLNCLGMCGEVEKANFLQTKKKVSELDRKLAYPDPHVFCMAVVVALMPTPVPTVSLPAYSNNDMCLFLFI